MIKISKLNPIKKEFVSFELQKCDNIDAVLDYTDRIRYINLNKTRIPQLFDDNVVFISYDSFQQNHKILSKQIRKYILSLIECNNIVCIGGESYLYGMVSNNIINIIHYTNSKSIYNDCKFNNTIFNKKLINNYTNYNICNLQKGDNQQCIINLANLNSNLMKNINDIAKYNTLIIINCHHHDFWKKIKLLSNYTLITRKKYICYKIRYFITVTVFRLKLPHFVSLGGNCAVSYNLRQLNISKCTYPFDWSRMSLNQLNNILENDFENFSNVCIKKYSETHNSYIISNNIITFAHEIESNEIESNEIDLNLFKEALIRRINRFRNLDNYKNLVFVRLELKNLTNKQMEKYNILIKNLDKFKFNYKLILISKMKLPNMNKKIEHYQLTHFNENWKYPNVNWKTIFQ